ncbi:MAG: hypothetical protein CML68_16780 [Rhodobacteraceae bacterium]|nr:hypothetical protein [Paracoccaceae bacterium]
MSDLKDAILDAKYIEMISLADYIVKDCALPDVDADGNLVSGQVEIAAAIFRWAVSQQGQDRPQVPESQAMSPFPDPIQNAVQTQGFAPMQDAPVQNAPFQNSSYQDTTAPIPMNNGFMPDTQG